MLESLFQEYNILTINLPFMLNSSPSFLKSTNRSLEMKVIDTCYEKSYMFQAAEKSRLKPKSAEEELRETTKLTGPSKIKDVFFSGLRHKFLKKSYFAVLEVILPTRKNMWGCCTTDGKLLVNVETVSSSEIVIRQIKVDGQIGEIVHQFNFNTVQVQVQTMQQSKDTMLLNICNKLIMKLQTPTPAPAQQPSMSHLAKSLQSMIKNSVGKELHLSSLASIENFSKMCYKSCTEFVEECESGDLILFRGSMLMAKLQRFALNSEYDHVGVLFKDPYHGILIFEATSNSGICLTPWSYVLKYKWYTYVERIMWRRLTGIERDEKFLDSMRDFIMGKLGKAYHISVQKILSKQSYIYEKPCVPETSSETLPDTPSLTSMPSQQSEQIGYFCSQLIAKCYKQLNLLSTTKEDKDYKPSCNYYPYHFTEKFQMRLQNGAALSKEFVIAFDEKQIGGLFQGKEELSKQ